MFNRPKIGIIGAGFVGNAVAYSYSDAELIIRDPGKSCHATYDELKQCEGIFICVPSPQAADGSCDGSILKDVLSQLTDYNGVLISKVTATPDIYESLQTTYSNLVYVPEFLTANNAVKDYMTEDWAIIGGKILAFQKEAERLISLAKKDLRVTYCSIGEAALHKYIVNSFLATKVVFMNEMAELASNLGYSWNDLSNMFIYDMRVGPSHNRVPGPDGMYGFGGYCFPKDTEALLTYARSVGLELNVLGSAIKKNTLLRLKNRTDDATINK